ncbi:hypothetical protein PRUPE_4G058500 [Prunus persica]|uniref:Uncharacterized protein n=1 Tax=Prunus persica TaxID=3760 RepID=A0A251PGD0_PRUPE|nr:hypothetical protein PRUPE_4G058500 [Prunus persica]
MGDSITYTNNSLGIQLDWFKEIMPYLCNTSSTESLGLPLVLPYLESLISNQTVQNFEAGVNFAVIGAMALDASFLATMGVHNASTNNFLRIQLEWFKQMLPSLCKTSSGDFPIGCLPAYLTKYGSSDKNQYDPKTGCLKWLNEFSQYHNEQLQIELSRI